MRLARMSAVVMVVTGMAVAGSAASPPAAPGTAPAPPVPMGPRAPLHAVAPKPKGLSPQHKILEGFGGHWKATLHVMQDSATTPAQDTEGTADGKVIMNGRFAEIAHSGLMNGQPYEGRMIVGFDSVINRYKAVWFDSGGESLIDFVGGYDQAKKQLTLDSHYSDSATHRLVIAKIVISFVSTDNWVYDEYIAHAQGETPAHTMSITFKRG